MPAGPATTTPPDPSSPSGLPLRTGAAGPSVEDLHHRLRRIGHTPDDDGRYGPGTQETVRRFQEERGIRIDGVCGRQTWSALVEAGWRLGDRLLYERAPMLRGDDVVDLQVRLGGLGFLDDRIDGILGPISRRALEDFQRNCGLTVDGICGPETISELTRLGAHTPTTVKAGVVERARLRATPRQLAGRRVVIGDLGGVGALAAAVERALHAVGAATVVASHPDGSAQAQEANALDADLYLGLVIAEVPRCAYYATAAFASAGGQRLAMLLADGLEQSSALDRPVSVMGMRLPVLRETRMTAVVCELAPPRVVVERSAELAERVRATLGTWVTDPLPAPH
ncbi:peptidoglycan-binding protein [Iamia sp.]|uniref:peptidoglycan-binding protein n=1 Tax=Iamia sp. TaxID=2722710 RepID=UPI002BDC453C|nr:peptidoglycan-binding protein [Iamia sp.]HXH57790.1 peptidoglycan-binding protein [Iamia sp.]